MHTAEHREREDLAVIRRAYGLGSQAAARRVAARLAAQQILYPTRPRELLAALDQWAASADWQAPPRDARRLADLRRQIRACLGRPAGPAMRRRA